MNKDLLVAIIIFKIWIILIVFTLIFSSQKDKSIEKDIDNQDDSSFWFYKTVIIDYAVTGN